MRALLLIHSIILLTLVTLPACVSAFESEHYRMDSYSYGETAHANMRSENYAYESVSDVNEESAVSVNDTRQYGSITRRPRGAVAGLSSTTESTPTYVMPSVSTEPRVTPYTGVVSGASFSPEVSANATSTPEWTTPDSPALTHENATTVMPLRTFSFHRDRFMVLILVLIVLALMRKYTTIGRRFSPF